MCQLRKIPNAFLVQMAVSDCAWMEIPSSEAPFASVCHRPLASIVYITSAPASTIHLRACEWRGVFCLSYLRVRVGVVGHTRQNCIWTDGVVVKSGPMALWCMGWTWDVVGG